MIDMVYLVTRASMEDRVAVLIMIGGVIGVICSGIYLVGLIFGGPR